MPLQKTQVELEHWILDLVQVLPGGVLWAELCRKPVVRGVQAERSYESGSTVSLFRLFLLAQAGISFHLLRLEPGKVFNGLWRLLIS